MNPVIANILKKADNRSFSVEVSNIVKSEADNFIKTDWAWEEGKFRYDPGKATFSGKPTNFIKFGVIGGLVFDVTWDPQVRSERPFPRTPEFKKWEAGGGSQLLQNRVFKINVEVSVYPGPGSQSFNHTDLGSYKVVSTSQEKLSFVPGQSFSQFKILQKIVNDIVSNPPPGMKSAKWQEQLKKDWDESESQREKLSEQQKIQQQQQQRREILEGEKEFYGSLDIFDKFVREENDGIFGVQDLQKLMRNTHMSRKDIMEDLKNRGLTFSPELKQSLAMDIELRNIIMKLTSVGLIRQARSVRTLLAMLP